MAMYFLQNRWRLEGNALQYYGLRNRENLFRNRIRLSRRQLAIVAALPKALTAAARRASSYTCKRTSIFL